MSWLALIDPISTLLDKIVPDKDARDKLAHEKSSMAERNAHDIAKAQIDVNKQAAAHKSLFVAGARPAALWTCVLSLFYSTLAAPVLSIWYEMPAIDDSLLTYVLDGLLGLGGMRTAERFKGVERNR